MESKITSRDDALSAHGIIQLCANHYLLVSEGNNVQINKSRAACWMSAETDGNFTQFEESKSAVFRL